jgi:hypothetical protein
MIIRNLFDLSLHLGCAATVQSIERRLYKDSSCGISFCIPKDVLCPSVAVSGFVEGTDGGCERYVLTFPFDSGEFDDAVANADDDGCTLFNETHCFHCGGEVPTSECDCDEALAERATILCGACGAPESDCVANPCATMRGERD